VDSLLRPRLPLPLQDRLWKRFNEDDRYFRRSQHQELRGIKKGKGGSKEKEEGGGGEERSLLVKDKRRDARLA
jgi:hypothetical protein